jgi:hypothetical protein
MRKRGEVFKASSLKECQIPPIPLIAVCLRGTRELGNDFSNTTHISLQNT